MISFQCSGINRASKQISTPSECNEYSIAFGQEALNEVHGPRLGEKLCDDLYRLEDQIFPMIDRAHRMMMRSLAYLDGRDRGRPSGSVRVDRATQVNVGAAIGMATWRPGDSIAEIIKRADAAMYSSKQENSAWL